MKISELPGHNWSNEYFTDVNPSRCDVSLSIPAATLWVVQPPPPDALMNSTNTIDTMEQDSRAPGRNYNFWVAVKKARNNAKEMNMPAKNNFLTQKKQHQITFHNAMRFMLVAGQMFGLNPVLGVLEKDTTKLRFNLISWPCFYTLISFMGQAIVVCMCVYRCAKEGLDFNSGTNVIFYGSNCLTTILFLRVATRWPALCLRIAKNEIAEQCQDDKLAAKCNVTCILVLTLALMEHIFSIIAGIHVVQDCSPNTPLYEAFVKMAFPWVFNYLPYTNLLGFITQFFNLQSTFNWNFTDLFVICISYYLTARFEQVNKRIYAVRGKYMPSSFWRTAREDYCRVTQLVRNVDDVISGVVFISFSNNLYFICLQLFHTLEDGIKGSTPTCNNRTKGLFGGYEHAVYFVYSFVYLMTRSLAVSLLVARVHSSARAPAPALYDVPSPVYCVEVQRFVEQVTGDNVALTGLRFFNVTRGLVLTIAGTIVTYELVLVQFNATPPAATSTFNVTTIIKPVLANMTAS